MKTLTYDIESMKRAGQLLNQIVVQGVSQARIIAELGDILDSGKVGEILERSDEKDGMVK